MHSIPRLNLEMGKLRGEEEGCQDWVLNAPTEGGLDCCRFEFFVSETLEETFFVFVLCVILERF